MRSLIFGVVLVALATIGSSSFISAALSATRDAKSATFSTRFAPATNVPACPLPPGPWTGSGVRS
ncbi:hypothetical protein E4K64_33025 [Bradyrhizobium frederickii]|uniref:Uncharacterized protein n=1 Tax=Bradyrhizobium frederickii TaxID=2560054 RepID=A0A4Y9NNY1_9BRAD|nr:hypothetical protein E4K64_33025 [Bradyrhizobium frederickii]